MHWMLDIVIENQWNSIWESCVACIQTWWLHKSVFLFKRILGSNQNHIRLYTFLLLFFNDNCDGYFICLQRDLNYQLTFNCPIKQWRISLYRNLIRKPAFKAFLLVDVFHKRTLRWKILWWQKKHITFISFRLNKALT